MNTYFENYLFNNKSVFVEAENTENAFEVAFTLGKIYDINIVKGINKLGYNSLLVVKRNIPNQLPEPFYVGFPESVKKLSKSHLLFDQLFHYYSTYGLNNFDEAGHSIFEQHFNKTLFKGKTNVKNYSVISKEVADKLIDEVCEEFCKSTRPLNKSQYEFLKVYLKEKGHLFDIASKNTLINLAVDTKRKCFISKLYLSDVYNVVEYLAYTSYKNSKQKHIRLKSADRKFITKIIDSAFSNNRADTINCFEKQAFWCGILHQIHYKPKKVDAVFFCDEIRSGKNQSVYSEFEKCMNENDVVNASKILITKKGSGAFLRHIDYILSRAKTNEDIDSIIDMIDSKNTIILFQLLIRYKNLNYERRSFVFTKRYLQKSHTESDEEVKKRKSILSSNIQNRILERIENNLRNIYKDKFGKVFIDKKMKKIALPLQETTSSSGFGVLSKGSRIPVEITDTFRAFTYWEKVNDIDLSCFGINEKGKKIEFSWRTMFKKQSNYITYSGDQTSGYKGGSEYFDIKINEFLKKHPTCKYIVFCNNIYSCSTFDNCFCKAGYMIRDNENVGRVYEPKTVNTAFQINANSTYAYLFALDLKTSEVIWLNMVENKNYHIAGESNLDFVDRYINMVDYLNVYKLFELGASQIVDKVEEADYIVSDDSFDLKENQIQVRSNDFSKLLALMNNN